MQHNHKILIFAYTLASGGSERFISLLLHSPLLRDYQIDVLLFYERIYYQLPDNVTIHALYPDEIRYGIWHKLCISVRGFRELRHLAKRSQYRYILSFGTIPTILAGLLKRFYSQHRVIANVRTQLGKKYRGGTILWLYRQLHQWSINRVDLVLSNSEAVCSELRQQWRIRTPLAVIPNAFDATAIRQQAQAELLAHQHIFTHPVVLTIGRLTRAKGQWHLLRAFTQVAKQNSTAQLVVIGEGELEQYLHELARELKIAERVHFLGFCANPFAYLARCQVFVLSSLWEGFPNALIEAMACQVPIISSDCGSGPRELLACETDVGVAETEVKVSEYGILVPVADGVFRPAQAPLSAAENALAKAINQVLQGKLRFARRNLDRFSVDRVVKEYLELVLAPGANQF